MLVTQLYLKDRGEKGIDSVIYGEEGVYGDVTELKNEGVIKGKGVWIQAENGR